MPENGWPLPHSFVACRRRRFSGFGVGRGFAIWGPFRVQASVKAPESFAWSTRSEFGGDWYVWHAPDGLRARAATALGCMQAGAEKLGVIEAKVYVYTLSFGSLCAHRSVNPRGNASAYTPAKPETAATPDLAHPVPGARAIRRSSRDAPTVWAGTGWSPTSQLAATPATNVKNP